MTKAMTGIAIALATMLASPAFAQNDAYGAYDQQVDQQFTVDQRQHSPNPAWDVYDTSGHYIGSDPDPLVRDQLAADPNEGGMRE